MLIGSKEILKLLRCPISGQHLKESNNRLTVEDQDELAGYDIKQGYPVLIDFENSLLKENDIQSVLSVIERRFYRGLTRFAK